jgi:hypothetical protein
MFGKILIFIGFLIWLAIMIILFSVFGWGGLIVGLVVSAGAYAIFSDR